MSNLSSFLDRNSTNIGKPLPLVHSTRAYFFKKIVDDGKINASKCSVFKENLNYFFIGRPSYKWDSEGEATEWELPVCFIFAYGIDGAKRIFPFDSGGYDRYPRYLNFIDRDEFNMTKSSRGPEKFIGAFFASNRDYFLMKPRPEHRFFDEFLVDIFDAEVKAIHRLACSSSSSADDRRCSLEVQFESAVDFSIKKPLAVIAPDVYMESEAIRSFIKNSGLSHYGYSTYSLNCAAYYSQIYNFVKVFYEKKGYFSV